MERKLDIFDTTLRDGGQCRGFPLSVQEKTDLALELEDLGVDILEAGYPRLSQTEFKAVHSISGHCRHITVAALSPANHEALEEAARALEPARSARLHVFLSTAPARMVDRSKRIAAQQKLIEEAGHAVRRACQLVDEVQFSPHDATRMEPQFLADLAETVVGSGARIYNISDSLGIAVPEQMTELIRYLKNQVNSMEKASLSVHCHNDLGLSLANALAAVQAGAQQVECTLGGIGERAGNTATEELVMALRMRPDVFAADCAVRTEHLQMVTQHILTTTGYTLGGHKPVVGTQCRQLKPEHYPDGFLGSAYPDSPPVSADRGTGFSTPLPAKS